MIDNGVVVALTPKELKALLTVTKERDYSFYVLVLISVCHGLRVSEAIALTRSNFSVAGNSSYISVQRLKGSKATNQRLIVTPDLLLNEHAVVTEYMENLKEHELLFGDGEEPMTRFQALRLIKRYGTIAGVPKHKLHFHVLKHTTGILLRKSGAKLEEIQEQLGHNNLDSTRQYLRVTGEEVDAAAQRAFSAVGVEA